MEASALAAEAGLSSAPLEEPPSPSSSDSVGAAGAITARGWDERTGCAAAAMSARLESRQAAFSREPPWEPPWEPLWEPACADCALASADDDDDEAPLGADTASAEEEPPATAVVADDDDVLRAGSASSLATMSVLRGWEVSKSLRSSRGPSYSASSGSSWM